MDKLFYKAPAKKWTDCLPLGNGNLGVMLSGGIKKETLYLNDDTLWSGYPSKEEFKGNICALFKARELIFKKRQEEAEILLKKNYLNKWSQSYLPLINLEIIFESKKAKNYLRELDLKSALTKSQYDLTDNRIEKEAFVSYPAKVFVYKINSQKPISVKIKAFCKLKGSILLENKRIGYVGQAPDYVAPNYDLKAIFPIKYKEKKGMAFCALSEIETNGKIQTEKRGLKITNATEIVIYTVSSTGFLSFDKYPETDKRKQYEKCVEKLNKLLKAYEELKRVHINDYSKLYSKVKLDLNASGDESISTDKLYNSAVSGNVKKGLVELFYNFGRYLTIAGSRKGTQPLNLQGIWNKDVRPPWSSNYTTNINLQMNYWHTAACNLKECMYPYETFMKEAAEAGIKTARDGFGCNGFVINHNVDIWRKTTPAGGEVLYSFFPMSGVWLTIEQYMQATRIGDKELKASAFSNVKQAVSFLLDWLVLHNGKYVTCPATSPELYYTKGNKKITVDYATAMDIGLSKELFECYLNGADLYDDNEFLIRAKEVYSNLKDYKTKDGKLLEWHEAYPPAEKGHRHFSPLYGVYPGTSIGYFGNPNLMKSAKALLDYRCVNGSGYTGWSAAWAACLYARMHQGEKAQKYFYMLLNKSIFKNLFGSHSPFYFQIDGNFGGVAAINEMLIQQEKGIIELLPALPENWSEGSLSGIVINDGATVNFEWKNGKVIKVDCDKKISLRKTNIDTDCVLGENIIFAQ